MHGASRGGRWLGTACRRDARCDSSGCLSRSWTGRSLEDGVNATRRSGRSPGGCCRGVSCGLPLVGAVCLEAQRDLLASGGEPPRVWFALGVPLARVSEQPDALQARQQLGDLPRVTDPRVIADHAVARPRPLRDTLQYPRGGIRQAHRDVPQRVAHTLHAARALHSSPRRGRRRASVLTARRSRAEIGQHDHPHQLAEQTRQRRVLPPQKPGIHDRERRADQPLRRQPRALPATRPLPATLIQDRHQTSEDLLATLKHPRTSAQRLHHTHPRERRLPIEKPKNRRQPHPHPPPHTQTNQASRRKLKRDQTHHILKDRRQTLLTISEQLIERAPRNTRTRSDMPNRRLRIAQLIDRANRTRDQPRTLNLHHPRTPPPHTQTRPHRPPTPRHHAPPPPTRQPRPPPPTRQPRQPTRTSRQNAPRNPPREGKRDKPTRPAPQNPPRTPPPEGNPGQPAGASR